MSETDTELLARYIRQNAEDAFSEIARRHINLVYSAALRQVRSPQLAEEVAQSAFLKLARHAPELPPQTIITAWLYQVTRHEAIDVVRREARRQLREQIASEMNATNASPDDWGHIAPLLDEAMHALDETDRTAVLLRYFENKSLREVGAMLGTSDDTAQKRVSRAVERLREFFCHNGVTVSAAALISVLSANAAPAAPAALVMTVSGAAALAGTISTTATITKSIAMSLFQKSLIAGALAAAIGAGIYEAREAARLRADLRSLRQQQVEQSERAERERVELAARLASLSDGNERLKVASTELMKLRAELARLHGLERERNQSGPALSASANPGASRPAEDNETELTKDSWVDAGFATPRSALRTRGWSVLNNNLERFAESVVITDRTRKAFEESLARMIEASNNPEQAKAVMQQSLENKYAIEEGLLMRLRGENLGKGYVGYRIVSQQSPSPEETLLEVETQMTSAPPRKEILTFRRFGNDWKVLVDKEAKTARQ